METMNIWTVHYTVVAPSGTHIKQDNFEAPTEAEAMAKFSQEKGGNLQKNGNTVKDVSATFAGRVSGDDIIRLNP